MHHNDVEEKVLQHNGRLITNRRDTDLQFDGKQYEYRAAFDFEEAADDFLEAINASKSGCTIDDELKCLVVYFSLP